MHKTMLNTLHQQQNILHHHITSSTMLVHCARIYDAFDSWYSIIQMKLERVIGSTDTVMHADQYWNQTLFPREIYVLSGCWGGGHYRVSVGKYTFWQLEIQNITFFGRTSHYSGGREVPTDYPLNSKMVLIVCHLIKAAFHWIIATKMITKNAYIWIQMILILIMYRKFQRYLSSTSLADLWVNL